jgi:phytoene dehydrogenase-like protein
MTRDTTTLTIIGAAIAGLVAGCYAAMNGYRTTIFEMSNTPGGLCTSWRRRGFWFDGCVAGLAGSAPGSSLFPLWKQIGVIDYCPLYNSKYFGRVILPDEKTVTLYTNIDKLELHLLDEFPSDAPTIREFTSGLRSVQTLEIPLDGLTGLGELIHSIKVAFSSFRHVPALIKYGSLTIREFAIKFGDPQLRTAFNNFTHFGGTDVSILTLMLPLAPGDDRNS